MPCSFVRSLRTKGKAVVGHLRAAETGPLFLEFIEWAIVSNRTRVALVHLADYFKAALKIDQAAVSARRLDLELVSGIFTTEELRATGILGMFLAHKGLTPNRQQQLDRREQSKIDELLEQSKGALFEFRIRAYQNHLSCPETKLSRRTQRIYLGVAIQLHKSFVHPRSEPTYASVRHFVRTNRGYAASLGPYLRFVFPQICISEWLVDKKPPRVDTVNAVAKRIASLLLGYRGSESPRTQSAIISKLLAETFGTKLATILQLRRLDVKIDDAQISVHLGAWIVVGGETGQLLLGYFEVTAREDDTAYLFPGRNANNPLTTDAVRYQLLKSPTG